jgi:ribose transport system substrate-binding protein
MRRISRGATALAGASLLLLLAACGNGSGGNASGGSGAKGTSADELNKSIGIISGTQLTTTGPNGESAVPADTLKLTPEEIAKVKAGHYKAALTWQTSSADQEAVTAGARAAFNDLGVEVVAVTNAEFDAAKQANQVATVLARKPDLLLAVPVDPTASVQSFKPAVDAGAKIVFNSSVPKGFTAGKDYVGLVGSDPVGMGKMAAESLGKSLNGKGKVGLLYFDSSFYTTNLRDVGFRSWLHKLYPDIQIVSQGFADPAKAQDAASAMLARYPDLNGIYVTWAAPPAQGVLAALRATTKKIKVVTCDLDTQVALDMIAGGAVVGDVVNPPYMMGYQMATLAAASLVRSDAPKFLTIAPVAVDAKNVGDVWQQSYGAAAPKEIAQALAQKK